MPRGGERRLARLGERRPDMSPEACLDRAMLRLKAELRDLIWKTAVRAASLHPVCIAAVYVCAEAANQLHALGDTPELALADEAVLRALADPDNGSDSAEDLEKELAEIAASYADGGDPGRFGSVLEWWGWAMAHQKPEAEPRPEPQREPTTPESVVFDHRPADSQHR
jgi:hypothetical protein